MEAEIAPVKAPLIWGQTPYAHKNEIGLFRGSPMASDDVTQTTSLPSTHLSSNLDFSSYTFNGGLDENVRDEKSDLSVRA
jgi:hypothetical protein